MGIARESHSWKPSQGALDFRRPTFIDLGAPSQEPRRNRRLGSYSTPKGRCLDSVSAKPSQDHCFNPQCELVFRVLSVASISAATANSVFVAGQLLPIYAALVGFRREMSRIRFLPEAPRASRDRTSRSRDTEPSPASIFATRD